MPNQPKTPLKCFRVPDDLYQAAMRRAAENGETLTDAVRRFLREYVEAGTTTAADRPPGQ